MDRRVALKKLKQFVLTELNGVPSGGNGWYRMDGDLVCHKCATDKTTKRAFNMLILENEDVWVKCFKASCVSHATVNKAGDPTGGRVVTREVLRTLGFTDEEAISALMKSVSNGTKRQVKYSGGELIIKNTNLSQLQSDYLYSRCKIKPSVSNIHKYHILPDVVEIIEDNSIKTIGALNPMIHMDKSISFLSSDADIVISRNLIPSRFKTSKMKISSATGKHGYVVGNRKRVRAKTLVVAEGIFDIINIHNVFAQGIPDALYVATLSVNATASIINAHYWDNVETLEHLVLFLDSDEEYIDEYNNETRYRYRKAVLANILRNIKRIQIDFKNITICYNVKGKDCGDLSDNIQMKREDLMDW